MVLGGAVLGVIAIFLPPLAVFIRRGCGADLLINIGLLFLAWIPGIIHAWWIILEYPSFRQRRRIKQERRRSYAGSVRSVSPYRGSLDTGHVRRRSTSRPVVYERRRIERPAYRDEVVVPVGHRSGRRDYYVPPAPRSKY